MSNTLFQQIYNLTKVSNLTHWFLLISHFFWLPIPHMHLWFIKSWRSMNSQELIHPWEIDHWSSTELSLLVTYSHSQQHILFLHWYYLVSWKTCLLCQAENTTQVFNTECPTEVVLHPSLIVRYNTTKTTAFISASCFFPI